jgi:hypothetical protein
MLGLASLLLAPDAICLGYFEIMKTTIKTPQLPAILD